jgi:hypothetical protein
MDKSLDPEPILRLGRTFGGYETLLSAVEQGQWRRSLPGPLCRPCPA